MAWDTLSAALSGAVVTLGAVLAALAWRDGRTLVQGRMLAALAASICALELTTGPLGGLVLEPLWSALRLASGLNVALLWLFCMVLLRDRYRPGWVGWLWLALLVAGPVSRMLPWPQAGGAAGQLLRWLDLAVAALPLMAIAHVAVSAALESRGDLVAGRLRARLWLPLMLVGAALVSVLSENIAASEVATVVRTGGAALPGLLVALVWLVGLAPERLRFEGRGVAAGPEPGTDSAVAPRDLLLLDQLQALMQSGAYAEPGLGIDTLAERLKVPAHRLRALINQGLGFRNFPAFVNSYRLAHARTALADPQRARETVLAIAFESGFAALQTFNRVFRDEVGQTPTEYRDQQLLAASQSRKTQPDS
jgi:AraC-like DNA-binding protein